MWQDVFAKDTVHARLPTLARGLEVPKHRGATAIPHKLLCIRIGFGRGSDGPIFGRTRHHDGSPLGDFGQRASPHDDWLDAG